MTEAGWTAEPKEEGWHWWRKPSDGLTIPYVVKVQKASSGWFVLWQHDWNYAEVLGGEFLGPISPTDRQQGRVAAFKEVEQRFDSMFGATDRRIDSVRDYRVDKFYTWLAQAAQDEKGVGE